MPRFRLNQKSARVLRFLLGLKNRRIAGALVEYGFGQEDLDEGWTVLKAAVGERLDVPAMPEQTDPNVIEQLDTWENKWFPISEATLSRHYPHVYDDVFNNLSRTSGPAVVVSVGTFIERVEGLAARKGDFAKARALLAHRGLKDETIARAKALLAKAGSIEAPEPSPDPEEKAAMDAAAENNMWAWYLEWSEIARTAISDGNLLRQLGFRTTSAGAVVEDEEEDEDEGEDAPTGN